MAVLVSRTRAGWAISFLSLSFWAALPGCLACLGNQLGAIQGENAKDDERFRDAMRENGASNLDAYNGMIAIAEAEDR